MIIRDIKDASDRYSKHRDTLEQSPWGKEVTAEMMQKYGVESPELAQSMWGRDLPDSDFLELFSEDPQGLAYFLKNDSRVGALGRERQDALDSLHGTVGYGDDPFKVYERLAGEAEARNVQTRMDFTPEQRQAQPPWETLDVPEEELLVRMLQDGPSLATAWHGSPHKFSKFDMSKIGTGEGAQAYGHGLYAAENPKVAKDYQRNIRKDGGWGLQEHGAFDKLKNFKGEPIPENMVAEINSAWAARGPEAGKEKAIELFEKNRGEPFSDALNEIAFYGNWEPKGNLYKVDIPDDQIAKMLDWDAPLSKGFVKREPGTAPSREQALIRSAVKEGRSGEGYYEDLIDLYNEGGRVPRDMAQQKASEYLRLQGIPGIKYLDGGSRTGGKGTSNFVLFSDEIAKILERNDQPIGDLAEELLGK
jgi:hypothetical protein